MFREFIRKLSLTLSGSMVPERRRHAAPIRLWFDPDIHESRGPEAARAACIVGETIDLSRTGIAFNVPSIRVNEKYLVGQERLLNVEIELPNGRVHLRAIGRRYEKVGVPASTESFLVGSHIASLTGNDKEIYETFLKRGGRGLRQATAPVSIGVD